jgi:endonuclease YncB( thermonuclease family)
MSGRMRDGIVVSGLYALGVIVTGVIAFGMGRAQDERRQVDRPRNLAPREEASATATDPAILAAKEPGPIPKEDQLYVFAMPEKGTQSVLVLRVVDGDTYEGAFLVPCMFRVRGIDAPEMRDKGGRPAKEYLEKLIAGKLFSCNLQGREKYGRIIADIHLGKDQGWLSEAMIKAGHAKPYSGGKRE